MKQQRKKVQDLRTSIHELFLAAASGKTLTQEMSDQVDGIIRDTWQKITQGRIQNLDLIAVGGYGRAEVCPYSDWDLWLLHEHELSDTDKTYIQNFITALWDLRAEVGSAVRTIEQTLTAMHEDYDTATAALESRLLCGEGHQFALLKQKTIGFYHRNRKAFVRAKLDEYHQRHEQGGNTPFLMEPNVKQGKGGLRDVQAVFWMVKTWYGVLDITSLVQQGILWENEKNQLLQAQDFLLRLRCGLHGLSGREHDRLNFELQAQLAELMGYQNDDDRPAVEHFMKDYFRASGRIARVASLMVMHFEELLHPQYFNFIHKIGDGFTQERKRISIINNQVFKEDPLRLLRIFHVAQQERRQLSSLALRQIRCDVLLLSDDLRRSAAASAVFLKILRHQRNVYWTLKLMHDTGVLGRFIPSFRDTVGLGQFNRYHAYTVDEHTLLSIAEARNMQHHERQDTRLLLACEIMPQLKRPELLYLALLFHDIGKGKDGDHSIIGAELCQPLLHRLGLNQDAIDLVVWLVRHHLHMAVISQRYDISDPQVIADFADYVGDLEHLQYLLCLTVADIAAVGPSIWNDWKGDLLRNLYTACEAHLLGHELNNKDIELRIQQRLQATLAMAEQNDDSIDKLASLLPQRCVLQFPPRFLLPVLHFMQKTPHQGAEVWNNKRQSDSSLMVLANERKGLFADLCQAVSAKHLNIVAAHAFTLGDGRVLDILHIQNEQRKALREEGDIERIKQRVYEVLYSQKVPDMPVFKETILSKAVSIRVRELVSASSMYTAIEVTTADRPGLLSHLTRILNEAEVDVYAANISTFGERVVDVFFVREHDGQSLSSERSRYVCSCLQASIRSNL